MSKLPTSHELMEKMENLQVVRHRSKFKVTVPKPYPGVQYRSSKHLEERYSRFAENGAIVVGQLEMDGHGVSWLRISGNIFLPEKVGQIHILDRVDGLGPPEGTSRLEVPRPDAWWVCCPSNASQKAAEAASHGTALQQVAQPMRPEQRPH
eukprot:symbB.v1.2.017169.t1/scaffold1301.1/size126134/4